MATMSADTCLTPPLLSGTPQYSTKRNGHPVNSDSFDNPYDRAIGEWLTEFLVGTALPPHTDHLTTGARKLLSACIAGWNGIADTNRQGSAKCVHASLVLRRLLAYGGVETEALTVTAQVHVESETATIGTQNPRVRRHGKNTYATWTGHEVIWIPEWQLIVDVTVNQVTERYKPLDNHLLLPAMGNNPETAQSPRPGTTLVAVADALTASGTRTHAAITYDVHRFNNSYRDPREWMGQQHELDAAADHLHKALRTARVIT